MQARAALCNFVQPNTWMSAGNEHEVGGHNSFLFNTVISQISLLFIELFL